THRFASYSSPIYVIRWGKLIYNKYHYLEDFTRMCGFYLVVCLTVKN
ncbi:uncharacterized protein METZ01_LOCUS290955, partial [marine metagenome]